MFYGVVVQVEVVTLIILVLCGGVVTLIIPALTKCSVWWEYR